MRDIIKLDEWDKFYYHSRQFLGQQKIENESEAEEEKKVRFVLKKLQDLNYIDSIVYDIELFKKFRKNVKENFFIYWTAINPPMEHLLFALSYILKPKNILGIGIFTGNPVVWSMGPAICGIYNPDKLAAVEINKEHAKICKENFNKLAGENFVKVYAEDGFKVLEKYSDLEIDLLYLDANGKDPFAKGLFGRKKNTKRINYSLLKTALLKIKTQGYVMCHNAYQPSFRKQACDYLKLTENLSYFAKTSTIGIDEMGLEFSVKI